MCQNLEEDLSNETRSYEYSKCFCLYKSLSQCCWVLLSVDYFHVLLLTRVNNADLSASDESFLNTPSTRSNTRSSFKIRVLLLLLLLFLLIERIKLALLIFMYKTWKFVLLALISWDFKLFNIQKLRTLVFHFGTFVNVKTNARSWFVWDAKRFECMLLGVGYLIGVRLIFAWINCDVSEQSPMFNFVLNNNHWSACCFYAPCSETNFRQNQFRIGYCGTWEWSGRWCIAKCYIEL